VVPRPINLRDVDLNLLVSLDAILATRSVTVAAQRLALSKPAMSHALRRIRTLLGDEVLVRSGKDWVLTARARGLAAPVAALLQTTASLLHDDALDLATLDREFKIHTTDHVLSILGVRVGREVGVQAPSVALTFLPVQADDVRELRNDVDLGIGVFPSLPPEFRKQALFTDRFCCVLRRGHPLARGKRLTLRQYTAMHHVLVAPRGRPGGTADHALAELGERRRVTRSVPYFLSALHCVAESDCIATISLRLAQAHAKRFGLAIVKPPLELPAYTIEQVWHPRVDADPSHAWLRRLIAHVAHALPAL
jgi:DNA-binding transcriptional LysR family regulator